MMKLWENMFLLEEFGKLIQLIFSPLFRFVPKNGLHSLERSVFFFIGKCSGPELVEELSTNLGHFVIFAPFSGGVRVAGLIVKVYCTVVHMEEQRMINMFYNYCK